MFEGSNKWICKEGEATTENKLVDTKKGNKSTENYNKSLKKGEKTQTGLDLKVIT